VTALQRSIDIYLKLTDYPKAEVRRRFMRRAPATTPHYLRASRSGRGDYQRRWPLFGAIELLEPTRGNLQPVFMHCRHLCRTEAIFAKQRPISLWVALDRQLTPARPRKSRRLRAPGNWSHRPELTMSASAAWQRRRHGESGDQCVKDWSSSTPRQLRRQIAFAERAKIPSPTQARSH